MKKVQSVKSKAPKAEYKKTEKKVEYKGKVRTVYLRQKDGVQCVKCKNKEGKLVYRKVKKATASKSKKQKGGCGCAATTPTPMSGGEAYEIVQQEEASTQEGGAKRLNTNRKTELYKKAKKYSIKGRSKMTKKQLVVAVRAAHKALGDRLRRRSSKKSKKSA
jgi:hypothetical protein